MKQFKLQFQSIADVANCGKSLNCGYIINTVALTLTGLFNQNQLEVIKEKFDSVAIEPLEVDSLKSVYSTVSV